MRKFAALLLCSMLAFSQLWAQNRAITGKVTDDKGTAVANASVLVKGTTIGTTTGADGSFKLNVPATAKTLVVSSLNFETQEIAIGARNSFAVALKATGGEKLEDVVVTGIKTIKRTEYSGAVSRMERAQVENRPVGSFDQLLQGQVPGLRATTGSGQPGNPANITIRGSNSVYGGSGPLYVIDGIPVEAGVFQGINPNDIETMDILKDASAAALYGSRGSAGVIVITTRRGSSGKMKLAYSAQFGVKSKPDFAFRPMNTSELLKAQEDYGKIAGGGIAMPGWYYSKVNPRYATLTPAQQAAEAIIFDSISKINTNWRDEIFRTAPFSRHQISISGGTGKTRIFSSLEMYSETGTTARTDMQRGSWRTNVDYADDKFSLAVSSILSYTKRNFQQSAVTNSTGNPFLVMNIASPYSRVYKTDGSGEYATGIGANFVGTNMLDLTKWDVNQNDQLKAVLGLTMNYKLTKDISVAMTTGFDFRETQGTNYGSRMAFLRTPAGGAAPPLGTAGFQAESFARTFQINIRPSINYTKIFAEKHKVDVSVYGEYLRGFSKAFNLQGYGIDPRTPNTPAAITQGNVGNQLFAIVGGGKSENSLFSGLGILSYTYNDKYSFTGSFRRDGSSKLPIQNRWASFYSVGAVWTASKEEFIKRQTWISSLRLRASYGGAGNSDNFPFGDFGYLPTWGAGGLGTGLNGQNVTSIGNPDLKWETTYTLNIGTDFALFKNRLRGTVEWYNRKTVDVYLEQRLSAEAGGYTVPKSAGKLSNKGIEVDLAYDVIRKKDFVWTVTNRFSYNKNNVDDLGGVLPYTVGTSYVVEGLPLGSHYEVRWAGVNAATGQPLYYTKDGVQTTAYSANDRVQTYGTYEAPWNGGFGTNLRYKGFDLSILFSWQNQAYKTDNLEYFVENPVGFMSGGYNQSASLNFWKAPGDVATTPSPLYSTNFSSKIIHDASFLRLRDVTLSYTLNKSVTDKLKFISKARFYVQGSNLFIWTRWRGMDPEAGAVNINLSEFPNPRALTAGVDITF